MRPDLRSIILSKTLSSFSTHFLSPRAVFSTEADDTIFRPDFTAIWGHPRKSVQINGGPGGSDKTSDLVAQTVKRLPAMWEAWVRFLGREDPLEKEMAIPSSTLAWKIPWTEEPDRLQSIEWQRVGHD